MSDVGGNIRGYNLFAYCMNNPINMSDYTGNWPKKIEKIWRKVKTFIGKMFGVGVVQSQSYQSFEMDAIIYGEEEGVSTSGVIIGDVSKPVSLYVENASKLWKISEYKIGIQINIDGGGLCYSTNTMESSMIFSSKNSSLELMGGINKIGYTYKTGVDFENRTAGYYHHSYIRTIPTAAAVAGTVAACYYSKGTAVPYLITIFRAGAKYVVQ